MRIFFKMSEAVSVGRTRCALSGLVCFSRRFVSGFLLLVFSALPLIYAEALAAGSLLIKNARLIDATGSPPRDGMCILIRDGWITEIGSDIAAEGVEALDAGGATVLPGLIDAHMHFMWGPGSFLRECDWYDGQGHIDMDCWRRSAEGGGHILNYFRAYLACGVTTVLDAAAPAEIVEEIRKHLADGNPGPRFLPLGPFAAPPDGYGSAFAPPIAAVEDVKAHFDLLERLATFGAKTSIERGWGHRADGDYPIFSPEIREAFKNEAALRGKPVFIHATSERDMRIALEMAPRALMHTLINSEEKVSDDFIALMADSDTCQVTTLHTMDG